MRDPNYYQTELNDRTGDLSDEDKKKLSETIDENKRVAELKSAAAIQKESSTQTIKYDLEEFLRSCTHYTTENGDMHILEIQVEDLYSRVNGQITGETFLVEEFYINKDPLKKVVHIEEDEEPILKIEWK